MLLNVTVPVFNEQECLDRNVRRLVAFLEGHFRGDFEVVIADNGSTDASLAIATVLADELKVVRAVHLDEAGRGGALKASWTRSQASVLSYMDADLSSDLEVLTKMVGALHSGLCDITIGSRLLNPASTRRGWKREVLSRVYSRLVRSAFDVTFSDPQCGFKALSRESASRLLPLVEDNGWFFDTELLVLAEYYRWRIQDVPVTWVERKETRVRMVPTILADLRGILRLRRKIPKHSKARQNLSLDRM